MGRDPSAGTLRRSPCTVPPTIPLQQHAVSRGGIGRGVGACTSWHALTAARILDPLGMAATRTSLREAWNDPHTARAYWWDQAGKKIRPPTPGTLGVNVDGLAPAGAISATALDMTRWLRFLLHGGIHSDKALISPAALAMTWTPQISIGGENACGLGWFVRKWRGQRLVEHGGAFPGHSAEAALLPDSNIGFVVLTNSLSALPSIATRLVLQHLLADLLPTARGAGNLKPYEGRYIANFAKFSNEVFTILSEMAGSCSISRRSWNPH